MIRSALSRHAGKLLLLAMLALTAAVYWPGLAGGFLFDDYPNIVDNLGVQPSDASLPAIVRAALSSPASEFRRPLASLSFAANYLATGLNPYWMKLTNLLIHLLNGVLVFLLTRRLLAIAQQESADARQAASSRHANGIVAALVAAGWLLLPINLTAVLYVVQRMESLANLFVLLGLLGYVAGRQRMREQQGIAGFWLCLASLAVATPLGLLAKETAVMLPLYAVLAEWALFGFRRQDGRRDNRILAMFGALLALPLLLGLAWQLPGLLRPGSWATRDFTLGSRLLSEARIVADYISWTLLPRRGALSFYHDNFRISTGLLSPWTTLASIALLLALIVTAVRLRARHPLAALGIALYLGCHLLTGTILPLELVYEHRNYFASFGLLLAIVPPLAALATGQNLAFALPRRTLLAGLMLWWAALTAMTAQAWGNPLRLAEELASRAPDSPRAEYELGRTYIIYSHYVPDSPFTKMAYAPLERAAALPGSSILPQQALIFMNSRMHLPLKDAWWDSMIAKLKARKPGVQDESSLGALTLCAREQHCDLPVQRMMDAFLAALSHPFPNARLLAIYSDYAWNVLDDKALGLRMIGAAIASNPREPTYRITEIRMLAALGQQAPAREKLGQLQKMNFGKSLDETLRNLETMLDVPSPPDSSQSPD